MWKLIETAPKDGTQIVCWKKDWEEGPRFLRWKTNFRIEKARKKGVDVGELKDSYFGDPVEWDDYELAEPGKGPTHWHPLDTLPVE